MDLYFISVDFIVNTKNNKYHVQGSSLGGFIVVGQHGSFRVDKFEDIIPAIEDID